MKERKQAQRFSSISSSSVQPVSITPSAPRPSPRKPRWRRSCCWRGGSGRLPGLRSKNVFRKSSEEPALLSASGVDVYGRQGLGPRRQTRRERGEQNTLTPTSPLAIFSRLNKTFCNPSLTLKLQLNIKKKPADVEFF